MNAVMYARYSTDKQTELSIEAQFRACREYANSKGYKIVGQYDDQAISGRSTVSRTGYKKMIRDADAGKFDIILIHKYDRIARNLGDHLNLEKHLLDVGVQLIAVAQEVETNKEGKFFKTILWGMSEYYSDNLAEESRKGHKEIALRGMHNGGYPPFGYDIVDQKYVINPEEAYWVRRMFEACSRGLHYTELLEEMSAAGVKGKRGKPIRSAQITEILHNEKYSGVYVYSPVEEKSRSDRRTKPHAIRIQDAIPAIVSRQLWEEVQRIMKDRKRKHSNKYWCGGLVYCGECGAKMYGITATKKGYTYARYICSKRCGAKSVLEEKVNWAVEEYMKILFSPENVREIEEFMANYETTEKELIAQFEKEKKEKIAEKQKQIDALLLNMQSGLLPAEVVAAIGEQMQRLISERKEIEAQKPVKQDVPKLYKGWVDDLLAAKHDELPRILIKRIEIKNDRAKVCANFDSVVSTHGCGGTLTYIPTILRFVAMQLAQ